MDADKGITHYAQEPSLQSVQPLASRSLFWKARYVRASRLLPNIPALFWLTEVVRPTVFLAPEIGDGVAYFAVCQSVERNGLETRCFASAVAGIAEDQRRYNDENYSDFSFILPRKGWEGRSRIAGIDLLYVSQALLDEEQHSLLRALKSQLSERCVVIFEGLDHVDEQVGKDCIDALALESATRIGFEQGPGLTVFFREALQNERLQQLAKLTLGGHGYGAVQTIFTRLGQAHAAEQAMHALEARQADSSAALAMHVEQAERLQSEVTELRGKLEESGRAYDARSRQIASFQSTIFDLTSRLDTGEAQRSAELAEAKGRIARLQDAWAESESARAANQATFDEMAARLAARDEELAAVRVGAEQLAGEIGRRETVERDLNAALAAQEEALRELVWERDEARAAQAEAAAGYRRAEEELARRGTLEDELRAQLAERAGLEQGLNAKDAEIASLAGELERQRAAEAERSLQAAARDDELARLRGLLTKLETEHGAEREAWHDEIGRRDAELSQLRAERQEEEARHERDRQRLEGEAAQHRSDAVALRDEIEELKQARSATESEVQHLNRELAKNKVVEADVRVELHQAQSALALRFDELARMTELCEQRGAELAAVSASLTRLQSEHDLLVANHGEAVEALKEARQESGTEARRLQRELKASRAAEETLKAELASANAALSKLRADRDRMEKSRDEASQALDEARKEAAAEARRLQRELEASSVAEETLKAEFEEARSNLARRFEEIARITSIADERDAARNALEREISALRDANEQLLTEKQIQNEIRASALKSGKISLNRGLTSRFLTKQSREALDVIRASEFFDSRWYLETYSDIAEVGLDAAQHYLFYGAYEGRNPGPRFDTMAYYGANRDVSRSGENALVHYELHGRAKSRPLTEKQRRKA
ncbi:hypothetical protein [Kumtagia ephedrae]|nr:hypothetical protein [Mesorhizobium ephedrae]